MGESVLAQPVGEVKPADPYVEFKQPDSAKWASSTKRKYNEFINDAYADGFAKGKPGKACESVNGSVHSDCACQTCSGSRAAFAKQVELTGYDVSEAKTRKGF